VKEGQKMKYLSGHIFWLLFSQQAAAQLLGTQVFSFEHLSFGMKYAEVRLLVAAESITSSERTKSSIFKRADDWFLRSYTDTMYQEQITVGLQFSNTDSLLQSVIVTYIGIDSTTKKPYSDVDARMTKLWEAYSKRLGRADKERTVPFAGTIKEWSLGPTTVQMFRVMSISTLVITFLPRQ
jgi:hypothetical protein